LKVVTNIKGTTMAKMQYVSIDIETLGLEPDTCDVIEFGAVLDDLARPPHSGMPTFHCYITKDQDIYQGQPYAMSMHSEKLRRIANREKGFTYLPGDMLDEVFSDWLEGEGVNGTVVAAGKNFQGFDMRFLRRLGFGKITKLHHVGSCYILHNGLIAFAEKKVIINHHSISIHSLSGFIHFPSQFLLLYSSLWERFI